MNVEPRSQSGRHAVDTGRRAKDVTLVPVTPPPVAERVKRDADWPAAGEKRTRYHLPERLESGSPVGYRTRLPFTRAEGEAILGLLSLPRPTAFAKVDTRIREHELFDEVSLGILSARQSTNFRGHREVVLGPGSSAKVASLLRTIGRREGAVLDHALYTHLVVARPYRTPFTKLLTFIGHGQLGSLASVPMRAANKYWKNHHDIPTIGYLTELHLGVLGEALERAAMVASGGRRRAQVFLEPLDASTRERAAAVRELEELAGISAEERRRGARIGAIAQVGEAIDPERVTLDATTWRTLGANMLAFRSERIQPGVNAEESAPVGYQKRQAMDIPDELTVMAGRAAYNAFCHFTGVSRDVAKDLVLLERVDVLTPGGKERLREVRKHLEDTTDRIRRGIPRWADLLTRGALTRNVARGKKAFALAGQRIYVGGLSEAEVRAQGLDFTHALRAFGAGAARSAFVAEVAGCVELPDDCDLLAGVCLMAGPVNQNDIAKSFYGGEDLLAKAFPGRKPTSLLVWTLKAKTIADPIGNEEQLLNPARRGVLVDLRPAPHDVVRVATSRGTVPMRLVDDGTRVVTNQERAFADRGNFVRSPDGRGIEGNGGTAWPAHLRDAFVW
ncbi:MAG: hypothetical protein U0169_22020 [Polyangiaceae bacterium]